MPYQIIFKNDSLSHHGILGQKWGVRRYQNKDGSLTKAGIKRYSEETSQREKAGQGRILYNSTTEAATAWGNEDVKKFQSSTNNARKNIEDAQGMTNRVGQTVRSIAQKVDSKKNAENREKQKKEIQEMSDDELKNKVGRLNLENRYAELTKEEEHTAQQKVDKIVNGVSITLGAAATVLSIVDVAMRIADRKH